MCCLCDLFCRRRITGFCSILLYVVDAGELYCVLFIPFVAGSGELHFVLFLPYVVGARELQSLLFSHCC